MGINAWIKPMKFMFSIAIYLWTIAWFTEYVRKPRWAMTAISAVIGTVMIIESSCLLLQAARGTSSHFNVATGFDAAVFQTMGAMIGIDMLMSVLVLALFIRPSVNLSPVYLWSIRLGFVIFLTGGAIGGVMISNHAHTFGAPDGGPGVPFLNWSTVAGDLRIAHGLALHALQLLPLIGYAISRWSRVHHDSLRIAMLATVSLAYVLAVYGTYRQAIDGRPLIQNSSGVFSGQPVQPGPRTTRPGSAPVCSPHFRTCSPLTNT